MLPDCGRLTDAVQVQCEQIYRILRTDARKVTEWNWKLGVEPYVTIGCLIEELEVSENWDVRPHIADVKQLAPAVVADDDVRRESQSLQAGGRGSDHFGAPHTQFEFTNRPVGALSRSRRLVVWHLPDAVDEILVRFSNKYDLMPALGDEVTNDVQELTRKVLVNEQKLHLNPLLFAAAAYIAGAT